MRKAIIVALFAISTLFPAIVLAGVQRYYVTQSGFGLQNGSNFKNAWSVEDFNNSSNWSSSENVLKIDPGDTVYFSGTITSQIKPAGSGSADGGYITLDGYESGDCDPINSVCFSSTLFTRGILVSTHDYLILQDFRGTGGLSNLATIALFDSSYSNPSTHIIIKRNYIYDTAGTMFAVVGASDTLRANYITISENKMVGFGKDGDPAQGFNVIRTNNLVVSKNILGHEGSTNATSANIIELHASQYVVFENNDIYGAPQQSGIAIKELGKSAVGNYDIVIRYNKIHNNGDPNLSASKGIGIGWHSDRVYVFGNAIYDNGIFGIDLKDGAHNIYIWANLIYNHSRAGIISWYRPGITNDPRVHDVYINNNVIANNAFGETGKANLTWSGLSFTHNGSTNISVKNNIFYNNRSNATTFHQAYITSGLLGEVSLEHNQYYLPGKIPTIYYLDDYLNLSKLQAAGLENDSPVGTVSDPGFFDVKSEDFTIRKVWKTGAEILKTLPSITINNRTIALTFSDALDPNLTDWRKTPPVAVATSQSSATHWVVGAYGSSNLSLSSIYAPKRIRIEQISE